MARSLLLIDDDAQTLAALAFFFERRGWSVRRALDGRTGIELYELEPADVVITDLEMPGFSGLQVVEILRARHPDAVTLLLTGYGDIATAVRALQLGAENFLTKPVDYDHLAVAVERAHERAQLNRWTRHANAVAEDGGLDVLGEAPAMRRLADQVRLLAAGNAPVLLGGETGSGKGWLARRLHALSPRARAPFVSVNCAGLQATFLDSELFGREKGAFTDARQLKRGLFEVADGGTLFLDEIGDLAPALQPKLLSVLESRRFRRLGGTRELEVDVRLVAATHVDLRAAVAAGRFREDLYYRLAVLPLELPPLRARGTAEIARLAHTTLDELRRTLGRGPARLAPETLQLLAQYSWPGNIRELRNVLERVLLLAGDAEAVEPRHLPPEFRTGTPVSVPAVAAPCAGCGGRAAGDLSLEAVERAHVLRVLALCDHNKAHAARTLGITRATLYAKLRQYGAAVPAGAA